MRETTFSELWELGLPDESIAYITGANVNNVAQWRGKNGKCANPKRLRATEELAELLPEVGDRLKRRPTFGGEGFRLPPQKCTVIHVNREHLHYTVRFDGRPWLTESYRVV